MTKTVMAHLDDLGSFQDLRARADDLIRTQALLDRQWPALGLVVIALRQDTLVLATRSAAMAAKCRQLEPSLLAAVRPVHPGLTQLRVKPMPGNPLVDPPKAATSPGPRIQPHGLESLQGVASELPGGPLKTALVRLIKRQLQQR